MLDLDRQISTVVEAAELRRWDRALLNGTSLGSDRLRLLDGLVKGGNLSTVALTLLKGGHSGMASGNGSLSCGEGSRAGDNALLGGQVSLREVTEDGVLRPGEQLVVSHVESFLSSLAEKLLQVIFHGETA